MLSLIVGTRYMDVRMHGFHFFILNRSKFKNKALHWISKNFLNNSLHFVQFQLAIVGFADKLEAKRRRNHRFQQSLLRQHYAAEQQPTTRGVSFTRERNNSHALYYTDSRIQCEFFGLYVFENVNPVKII